MLNKSWEEGVRFAQSKKNKKNCVVFSVGSRRSLELNKSSAVRNLASQSWVDWEPLGIYLQHLGCYLRGAVPLPAAWDPHCYQPRPRSLAPGQPPTEPSNQPTTTTLDVLENPNHPGLPCLYTACSGNAKAHAHRVSLEMMCSKTGSASRTPVYFAGAPSRPSRRCSRCTFAPFHPK